MICLVCEPVHLRIEQPINSFQVESLPDPPRRALALEQHTRLVAALERLGVEVLKVPALPEAPYQVFTRDVLIGGLDPPILATLRKPRRQVELPAVRRLLRATALPFVESEGGCLEGGDVVVHGTEIFVGLGDRTERPAAGWLAERFAGDYEVHVLEMKPGFLHLDMVFNVLGPERCVWFPAAFGAATGDRMRERFPHGVEIGLAEQRRRSTNFLPVGESAAIASTTIAPVVREAIAASGRELHLVELGEIEKAGGSVRCATCLI